MRNRSNLLVLLGIAFFVVGGIIVYVLTNDDDGGSSASGSEPVSVVIATTDISAGGLADELIEQGSLKVKDVPANQLDPTAIRSLQQLEGATFVQGYAAQQQVTSAGVQTVNKTYEVPEGYEAMAVQLDFVAGGAGYVNVGDRINLFGAYPEDHPMDIPVPRADLLLTNVEVLDVNLTIPPRRGSTTDPAVARATGESVTFLLAVRADEAEKILYTTEFGTIYATIQADDAPPVPDQPGRDGTNAVETTPR